jgi:hypothetical protein
MASVGIHGSRSFQNVHDQEANLISNFKAGKTAALSALAANADSAKTFIDEERNWQMYGSSTGPDRTRAIHGAEAAPNPTAPNVPPGAAVQGPTNTNPVLSNGRGQYIQYDPQQRQYVNVPAPR